MLSINRHEGDKVHLDYNGLRLATITLGRIGGNKAQLVFEAPREVKITRGECDNQPQEVKT